MAIYVNLDQAKAHLKLSEAGSPGSPTAEDTDIQRKLDQAEALCLTYVGGDGAWTASDALLSVQAAILEQFAELYRFRGDDDNGISPRRESGYPSPNIMAKLYPYRDPTLA
jgi:hypothetical protein